MQSDLELESILARRREIEKNLNKIDSNMDAIIAESRRVANVARNSKKNLDNLDAEFEKCTGLTAQDIKILFVATGLQIVRQYTLTKFPERLDDQTAAKNTAGHVAEHSDRTHRYYNPSIDEIITNPVPFDANVGAAGALSGGGSMGHRVTAIGHDPIIGLVFGTANIATATLTNNKFESFHIGTNDNGRDFFKANAKTNLVLSKTGDKLLNQGIDGKKIVGISLMKEIVHLKSDIGTKHSLPLPVISVVNPKLASELAERGFDMANAVTIGKQMTYAVLINSLIAMLHGMFYDESVCDRKLFEVRTRKILSYSNIIATSSNLLYTGIVSIVDKEEAIKKLDAGGLIATVYRVATDSKFISMVKEEFIEKQFFDMIRGTGYSF